MTQTQPDAVVATVIKLSEGYVLQVGPRTVGYPTVIALGKGLVRELRRKPKAELQVSATEQGDASQAFNLGRLVSGVAAGELDADTFERGLQTYCADVYHLPWARPAIEGAREALRTRAETAHSTARGNASNVEEGATSDKANGIGWQAATHKAERKQPPRITPWVCGYCKRPSDCVFDTGEKMELRDGRDTPCAVCQRCLDDECGGEASPSMPQQPTPGDESDEGLELEGDEPDMDPDAERELMRSEVRYLVDNTGKRVGTMEVPAE